MGDSPVFPKVINSYISTSAALGKAFGRMKIGIGRLTLRIFQVVVISRKFSG
jgi:hypothetical protein